MSSRRAVVSSASPLDDASILLHVLKNVGPGQHLFISAVSEAWRERYKRVASVQTSTLTRYRVDAARAAEAVTSQMTLYSAVFASASRVQLAYDISLSFEDVNMQRMAGRVGDVCTLQVAHKLGLQLTDYVLIGIVEAASVPKLEWLHTQQGYELPEYISRYAATSGSIDTLRWLKEHGVAFTAEAC
jgi:hypothetical protein